VAGGRIGLDLGAGDTGSSPRLIAPRGVWRDREANVADPWVGHLRPRRLPGRKRSLPREPPLALSHVPSPRGVVATRNGWMSPRWNVWIAEHVQRFRQLRYVSRANHAPKLPRREGDAPGVYRDRRFLRHFLTSQDRRHEHVWNRRRLRWPLRIVDTCGIEHRAQAQRDHGIR